MNVTACPGMIRNRRGVIPFLCMETMLETGQNMKTQVCQYGSTVLVKPSHIHSECKQLHDDMTHLYIYTRTTRQGRLLPWQSLHKPVQDLCIWQSYQVEPLAFEDEF
jgi:hypothetical protein